MPLTACEGHSLPAPSNVAAQADVLALLSAGVSVKEIAAQTDTLTFCLSKVGATLHSPVAQCIVCHHEARRPHTYVHN